MCGEKIVLASEGTGCGQCGHPHHHACGCSTAPPPPPPAALEPGAGAAPANRSDGVVLFLFGLTMLIGSVLLLANLPYVLKGGGVPEFLVLVPPMVAPYGVIIGGWMALHRVPWSRRKNMPKGVAVAMAVATLAAGVLMV